MEEYNSHPNIDNNILHSQEFRLNFSESVGGDWKTLGRRLNIGDNCLDMIDKDNNKTNEKAYSMLTTWIQMNKNPTLEELKTALNNMQRLDLIRKIDEFTKTSNLPESSTRFSANKDISEICTALKSHYLTNYGKINEIQPPLKSSANVDLMHKFIDLCIVDAVNTQIDAVYRVERKKFLEKQLRYTPIPYSEIFMKEKSVTLISGIAGIGKTWLLRKCLLDWSNDQIWKNVKLVFYLECRRLNQYQNISNINELLNIFYKDIINDFSIGNHPALFIIDGLDEFKYLNELINPSSSYNDPIVNALKEIQKYKYVLAGRVYAIDQYQNISTEHSDKLTIQIMGFNENGINNYIENNVLEERKGAVKATLKESSIAKSMSSVPFYLSSMCKIISDAKNVDKNSFLTMTDLYANIFLYFLQKHIIKSNELIYQIMEKDCNKKYVLNICKIAYQLFVENKVIFSKEDIQAFIIDFDENKDNFLGFIERIETNLGYYYQFAHLTIMEFCASVYAYNCLSSKEIMAEKRLESCLSMICGLTNKSQNSLLKFLVNLNPSKSLFSKLISFFNLNSSKKAYEDPLFLFSILGKSLIFCCIIISQFRLRYKNDNDLVVNHLSPPELRLMKGAMNYIFKTINKFADPILLKIEILLKPLAVAFRLLDNLARSCFGVNIRSTFAKDIRLFKNYYSILVEDYEMTVTVKLHIIFQLVGPFCKDKDIGLCFFSEQAGEAAHYSFLKEAWERFKVSDNHQKYAKYLKEDVDIQTKVNHSHQVVLPVLFNTLVLNNTGC
ncbi:NACHT, LRR and PYD domains-containing protein 3-like [Hydra vulgaris]|uniref:NACHT, LRR and PYD domains-containing protein 3-like n=1 Tax=Hydra vulgaris TaxID=6087 RepID=A0ABM4B918_HYDVU